MKHTVQAIEVGMEGKRKRRAILHVLLEIPETNMVLQEFAAPLAETHDVSLCTYFPAAAEPPASIRTFSGDGSLRGFFATLNRALAATDYDVIHVHTPHVALPLLVRTITRPDLRRLTVYTVHNCFENHKPRNKCLLLPVFACFRRIVCCSRASYRSFPAGYRWLAGDRLRFVQNGVHLRRIDEVLDEASNPADRRATFTVASVGRLAPIKNLSTALAAFASVRCEGDRMICVGDGPLKSSLIAQGQQLGLNGSVDFTGMVDRNEVYRRIHASDVYVSTSFGEGLPVAVLEAMACSCPVILSDIEPHREVVGDAGFIPLVNPRDVAGFAKEIDRFRQMPEVERRNLGRRCAALVRERFSLDAMHKNYETIYDEVCQPLEEGHSPCK